jgi:hypothetical protein
LLENGGELTPEIEAMIATSDINLPSKIDSYAWLLDRMSLIGEYYKEQADKYAKFAKAARQVELRCKDNLHFAMAALNVDEVKGYENKFKIVNNPPSVVIEDEKLIDEKYKSTEIIVKVDKKSISSDLKDGLKVDGAHLEIGQSIRRFSNSPVKK